MLKIFKSIFHFYVIVKYVKIFDNGWRLIEC